MHSFLPATCPTYPILPHPTKPSPTETKNQKPKTKKRNGQQQTTQNLFSLSFTHLLLLLFPRSTNIFVDRHHQSHRHWKFEFHFSLRACMHKQAPSHLTSCVPYTFHVLTHTVGIRYLGMYLYFLQSTLFRRRHLPTHNIQDRTGKQVGTLLGWAGR